MTRPLRFLHLTTFYPPYSFGGDAMYIYRLSHALGELGHEVDVVHCVDSYHLLHPEPPEIEYQEHPNVHRHELRSGFGWLSPLLSHQTGRPLLKNDDIQQLLDSQAYDVIHYHNISLLGPEILRAESANSEAVKLYTTHEHWLICPTHVLWKFGERPCEKPECFRCTLMAKRPPQVWRYTGFLERVSGHVDRYLSPSEFTANMHGERGFPQPVHHLPYFIERVDDEWKHPAPNPSDRPYFLFVGRLEEIKGLQTVIELWDHVDRADLIAVGGGGYEAELKEQAAGNPRIKFTGPLPQSDLGAYYYHAQAVIVPSLTYETFGIIIAEAFARKTPVIVRDLGALPEVVERSGGGYIFKSDQALLQAIDQLLEQEGLREELGERGYRTFLERWTREAHLKMYFTLLDELALEKYGVIPWEP